MSNHPQIFLSPDEEERFGVRTARTPLVTGETLPAVLEFCRVNQVVFLIARCPVADIRTAQAMERNGFLLMDVRLSFVRPLDTLPPLPHLENTTIRPMHADEENQVVAVATEAFRNYASHYHADEQLDPDRCNEVYASWASRLCKLRGASHEVLVAEVNGDIVGFAALRLNDTVEGDGVLYGLLPTFQQKGIFRSLLARSLEWCRLQGMHQMRYTTQLVNISVQKVCTRLGFELAESDYTFHKWFDNE